MRAAMARGSVASRPASPITVLTGITLALACGLTPAGAQTTADSPDTVPARVAAAMRQAWPRAAVREVRIARRDGGLVYEIASVDRGRRRDLVYAPDGHLLELAEAIAPDSLPLAVRQALRRDSQGGDILLAQRVIRGADRSWEVQVRLLGRTQMFVYDAGGHRH